MPADRNHGLLLKLMTFEEYKMEVWSLLPLRIRQWQSIDRKIREGYDTGSSPEDVAIALEDKLERDAE